MNFKMKALVAAAVVATTMSGAANALTNNETFLVAYDSVALKTFVAALGGSGTTASFTGASNLLVNYSADTNWTNFITGATLSNITYQVLGFNATGNGIAGAADKILLTSNNALTTTTLNNSGMTNAMNDVSQAGGGINLWEAFNSSITGTSTGLIAGQGQGSGFYAGTQVFQQVLGVANTTAALGTDLNFWSLTRPVATSNGAQQVRTQFKQAAGNTGAADVWNLSSNGLLTYTGVATTAPIPEANSWAMMLLGLGFMGFVARRRRA